MKVLMVMVVSGLVLAAPPAWALEGQPQAAEDVAAAPGAPPAEASAPQSLEEQVRELVTFGDCTVLWSEEIDNGVKMVMRAPDQATMYDLLFELGESPLFERPEVGYVKRQEDGVKFEWTMRFTDKIGDAALRMTEFERLKEKLQAVAGK